MFKVSYSKYFQEVTQNLGSIKNSRLLADNVVQFIQNLRKFELTNQEKFPGKLVDSSINCEDQEKLDFINKNHLWHYHIGFPTYCPSKHKYQTSDWVIHFIWDRYAKGDDAYIIKLVDIHPHKDNNGDFYIPPNENLN